MKLQILLSDPLENLAAMAADDALLRMLARGQVKWLDAGREAHLCQQFGVAKQQDWPWAALARLGLDWPVDHAYWMLASPVHLQLQRDSFSLALPAPLVLSAEESEVLRNSINQHFSGEGFELLPGAQGHWHLRLASVPALSTTPLNTVAGRDIASWLPQGQDAQRWRQRLNEIQMLLFSHDLNQAREARGELPVNSLWLHGGGVLPGKAQAVPYKVYGDDASLRGLAALAGVKHASWVGLPALLHAAPAHALVLASSAELGTGWCALLWQALHARRIQQLEICLPRSDRMLHLRIRPVDTYKFWRKPIALEVYC